MFGYAMAGGSGFSWLYLFLMGLGGFFVTVSSNILNQVIEIDSDKLMDRTMNRPLPSGRLSIQEAILLSAGLGVIGIYILGRFFNLPTALLGIIGLISYAFVYTPMKRVSPFGVFIGAIPGALPPLIGWVGVTGALDAGGLILFAFQFLWQFPHFWAIAWLLDDDYQKASLKMLPSSGGKTRFSASLILIYTASLIPMAFFPYWEGMIGELTAVLLFVLGLLFCYPAYRLYKELDGKYARYLLLSSFLYLLVMQILFLIG